MWICYKKRLITVVQIDINILQKALKYISIV